MKKLIVQDWSFMRVLRLVMGIAAMAFAIADRDHLLGIAGLFLLLTGIFNTGCCGATGCSVNTYRSRVKAGDMKPEEIEYEEVT